MGLLFELYRKLNHEGKRADFIPESVRPNQADRQTHQYQEEHKNRNSNRKAPDRKQTKA